MSILYEKLPLKEYKAAENFFNNNEVLWGNIMVLSRKEFDEYCSWLFPILFAVYDRITLSSDPYQKRAIGFMAERLASFYFLGLNKKKYYYLILYWAE